MQFFPRPQQEGDDLAGKTLRVRFEVNVKRGDTRSFVIEAHRDWAPRGFDRFAALVEEDFFGSGKCRFFRNIKGFMLQGGDPTGTGKGGESIWGGKFADEIHPDNTHSARGTLSMANAGPNTNGSQFFLTYGKAPHLDNNYAVFGKTIDGWDTLDAMERQPVNEAHRPLAECAVQSITIHANPLAEQMIVFPTATGPPDIQS